MGADYQKEAARRAEKGWRDGAQDLKDRKLFDQAPPAPERTLLLKIHPQCPVRPGDNLLLQEQNGELAAFNGLALVGQTANVSPEIQRTVNYLGAATSFVTDVDRIAGTIELAVACTDQVETVD